jgi:hypothetical protein
MVVRAQLVETERGLVPEGDGWFVLNAREAEWWELRTGGGALCDFEGERLRSGSWGSTSPFSSQPSR